MSLQDNPAKKPDANNQAGINLRSVDWNSLTPEQQMGLVSYLSSFEQPARTVTPSGQINHNVGPTVGNGASLPIVEIAPGVYSNNPTNYLGTAPNLEYLAALKKQQIAAANAMKSIIPSSTVKNTPTNPEDIQLVGHSFPPLMDAAGSSGWESSQSPFATAVASTGKNVTQEKPKGKKAAQGKVKENSKTKQAVSSYGSSFLDAALNARLNPDSSKSKYAVTRDKQQPQQPSESYHTDKLTGWRYPDVRQENRPTFGFGPPPANVWNPSPGDIERMFYPPNETILQTMSSPVNFSLPTSGGVSAFDIGTVQVPNPDSVGTSISRGWYFNPDWSKSVGAFSGIGIKR